MKKSSAIQEFVDMAHQQDIYWVERAKIDFAISLEDQRKKMGMSLKAIAQKIGTSAAYISKVFRGDTNFTIETMVKLARSTGAKLEIKVVGEEKQVDAWLPQKFTGSKIYLASTYTSIEAQNDENIKAAEWRIEGDRLAV